jgi:hypothetical protein
VINVVKHIVRSIRKYAATIVTIAVAAMVMSILPTAAMAAWKVGAIAGASGGFVGGLASGGGIKAAIKGAIFGGLSGAAAGWVAHGTGIAAKGAVGAFGDGTLKELVHGVTQGAIAKLRGGDFKSGFIGAIVGKYANRITKGLNLPFKEMGGLAGKAIRTAIAAVTGGLAAKITGGRFEDGAVSAAFRWLFNDEGWRNSRTGGSTSISEGAKGNPYTYGGKRTKLTWYERLRGFVLNIIGDNIYTKFDPKSYAPRANPLLLGISLMYPKSLGCGTILCDFDDDGIMELNYGLTPSEKDYPGP